MPHLRQSAAIAAASFLAGCISTHNTQAPNPEVPAAPSGPTVLAAPESDPAPSGALSNYPVCEQKLIRQTAEANLPTAMRYPPHSAHRDLYLSAMLAKFELMKAGLRSWDRSVCEITIQTEIQRVLLRLEDGHAR